MFLKLAILMILIPAAEVVLLVASGMHLGLGNTFTIIVFTGLLGAAIARREGAHSWKAVRETWAKGKIPAIELIEGALVLASGLVLLTPGFITDAIGFSLLIRPIRRAVANFLFKRYKPKVHFRSTGFSTNFSTSAGPRPAPGNQGDPIDVEHRDVDDPALSDH